MIAHSCHGCHKGNAVSTQYEPHLERWVETTPDALVSGFLIVPGCECTSIHQISPKWLQDVEHWSSHLHVAGYLDVFGRRAMCCMDQYAWDRSGLPRDSSCGSEE